MTFISNRSSRSLSRVWTNLVFISICVILLGIIFLCVSHSVQPGIFSEILHDFGILLASIGIISSLYEMLIRKELLADYNSVLQEILDPDSKRLGIVALFRNRHDKASRGRLPRSIIAAPKDELVCLGLGLYQFVPEQQSLIRRRIEEGCKFRFVLFDMDSPNIAALEKSLGYGDGTLTSFIRNATSYFINFKREMDKVAPPEALQVRISDVVPPWGLIGIDYKRSDGRILIEFNGFRVEGSQCPSAELVETEEGWYRFFSDQFETMWEHAKPLIVPPVPSSTSDPSHAASAAGTAGGRALGGS